jgi:hypothetical protein
MVHYIVYIFFIDQKFKITNTTIYSVTNDLIGNYIKVFFFSSETQLKQDFI